MNIPWSLGCMTKIVVFLEWFQNNKIKLCTKPCLLMCHLVDINIIWLIGDYVLMRFVNYYELKQ